MLDLLRCEYFEILQYNFRVAEMCTYGSWTTSEGSLYNIVASTAVNGCFSGDGGLVDRRCLQIVERPEFGDGGRTI